LKIIIPERQPITNGLAIVWLVDQQSATNQHQQWFQQEVINSSLVVIFIFSFLIGFGSGLEVINFQPIAKPQRCTQFSPAPYIRRRFAVFFIEFFSPSSLVASHFFLPSKTVRI